MTARHTYTDAHLHHWGEVFTANVAIRAWYESRGLGAVAFLSFIQHPEEILQAIIYGLPAPLPHPARALLALDADQAIAYVPPEAEFYPLLPAQDNVRLRLILAEITLPAPVADQVAA